jgi:hypothetical protein
VFDLQETGEYDNIAILDDHSSTIMAVKFAEERGQTTSQMAKRLKFISCGADK